MKILFVGGGSLGPVTPLLATVRALRAKESKVVCVWVGTPNGPERALVEAEGISFSSLTVLKWPRYISWAWFTFPLRWLRVQREAARLLASIAPHAIVSAGGFTATPLIRLAAKKKIPCFIHQLDVEPGLSNRLVASLCASVTTSFEYIKRPFGERVCDEPLPTPVRYTLKHLPSRVAAAKAFGLDPAKPIVFVYGGGQGAQALNEVLERTLSAWLAFTQVIHVTGMGKSEQAKTRSRTGYVVRSLLDDEQMGLAHAAADLEIVRGGIGSLSEIASLKKAAVVVPMPDSHQEANAKAFEEQGAVVVFDQRAKTFADDLLSTSKLLLSDPKERAAMGERAHQFFATDDGTALAARILRETRRLSSV